MKLSVGIDGNISPFEWSAEGDSVRFRLGDAASHAASLVEVEPGIYSVLLNGASYEAKVVPAGPGSVYVDIGARHLAIEIIDPRRAHGNTRGRRGDGPENLSAPMPGRIVRVLASEGDAVHAGQGLIVIEAMKMQNEMKSPKDGKLIALQAVEGATVAAGDILAVIG
ncbi:MAG: biotin/lipoyl-binding protein [Acidobacteria bacterium]|nr:biotin/lipoyl-binding protein [Acidobacteriota bacterium]